MIMIMINHLCPCWSRKVWPQEQLWMHNQLVDKQSHENCPSLAQRSQMCASYGSAFFYFIFSFFSILSNRGINIRSISKLWNKNGMLISAMGVQSFAYTTHDLFNQLPTTLKSHESSSRLSDKNTSNSVLNWIIEEFLVLKTRESSPLKTFHLLCTLKCWE